MDQIEVPAFIWTVSQDVPELLPEKTGRIRLAQAVNGDDAFHFGRRLQTGIFREDVLVCENCTMTLVTEPNIELRGRKLIAVFTGQERCDPLFARETLGRPVLYGAKVIGHLLLPGANPQVPGYWYPRIGLLIELEQRDAMVLLKTAVSGRECQLFFKNGKQTKAQAVSELPAVRMVPLYWVEVVRGKNRHQAPDVSSTAEPVQMRILADTMEVPEQWERCASGPYRATSLWRPGVFFGCNTELYALAVHEQSTETQNYYWFVNASETQVSRLEIVAYFGPSGDCPPAILVVAVPKTGKSTIRIKDHRRGGPIWGSVEALFEDGRLSKCNP